VLSTEMAIGGQWQSGRLDTSAGQPLSALAITCAVPGRQRYIPLPCCSAIALGNLYAGGLNSRSIASRTITGLPLAWQKC
jgi:hypothetical protein